MPDNFNKRRYCSKACKTKANNRERMRRFYRENKEEIKRRHNENPLPDLLKGRRYNAKIKMLVLQHYSPTSPPCCVKCGFEDFRVLQLDHLNGGGNKQRVKLGNLQGTRFYRWLIVNDFPNGFQVLCANCNVVKRYEEREFRKR